MARQPRVIAAFALSALLLSANWSVYVWAVQNAQVVDASLGYFILPLVNVAFGFLISIPTPHAGQAFSKKHGTGHGLVTCAELR